MARHGALCVIEGLATNRIDQCFLDVGWPRFAVKAINLAPMTLDFRQRMLPPVREIRLPTLSGNWSVR